MTTPRGLSDKEAAAWTALAKTVTPLNPSPEGEGNRRNEAGWARSPIANTADIRSPRNAPRRSPTPPKAVTAPPRSNTLDGHRDRRIRAGRMEPDFSLDLHGHTLDAAYRRLDSGLAQALAMGARMVLVVTGKPRPVDAADRAHSRGAIRAKILDWLAAGPHAHSIAAVRKAHRKHGGEGALYLVLRRRR